MSNDIELNDEVPTIPPVTRRTLLTAAAGAIGAGLVATACGSRSPGSIPTAAAPAVGDAPFRAPTPVRSVEIDWQIAELAAGLEVLGVQTYDAALAAASSGALGTVPPAVAEFVTVAKAITKRIATHGTRSSRAPAHKRSQSPTRPSSRSSTRPSAR